MPEANRAAELTRDHVVDAALRILEVEGLDAVSMRRVALELGVSSFPLYSRVGNKDAILDAMADHLIRQVAVQQRPGETWFEYADRWCHRLRQHHSAFRDSRLLLRGGRDSMAEVSRPLVRLMLDAGIDLDQAIDSTRLMVWSVLGHCAIELGHAEHSVTDVDVDGLFDRHIRYLIDGLRSDGLNT